MNPQERILIEEGTVIHKGDLVQVSPTFRKQELVVKQDTLDYPQELNFEFIQDHANIIRMINVGDKVRITFHIRGRNYNGRWYINLTGTDCELLSEHKTATEIFSQEDELPPAFNAPPPTQEDLVADVEDGLPF